MYRLLSCLLLSASLSIASPLADCVGRCAVWLWGPSTTDLTYTERQPDTPGVYQGHAGTFIYWDYVLTLEPFQWIMAGDYSGPGPLGPPVEVGSREFAGRIVQTGEVLFQWYDPGFEGDPAHSHLVTVTPWVETRENVFTHSLALWQCEEGITPPEDGVPWPEPSGGVLMLSGAGVVAWVRRRRGVRATVALRRPGTVSR